MICAADVPDYQSLLQEPDTYFYRYDYNPTPRSSKEGAKDLFSLVSSGSLPPAALPIAATQRTREAVAAGPAAPSL